MSTGSQSTNEHREKAKSVGKIGIALITVSDTRTPETDVNSRWLREQIEALGHEVTAYRLIKDEPGQVAAALEELSASPARILLWNGGTGIAPRDTTFDVLSRKLEKTLPGFGEIFRMLSFEVVGPAAMLSRATAGVYKGKLVVSTPGSPNAVQLAWNRLLAPELEHLAWEVIR
ncbi:MAG TPA: molybdenum cofactor biosynthesis protein B [Bryobacteraceae bacterium]|nr:molybdenum cofactor biosynthesis protein B [Bryobacteraceae bacterium]